MLDANMRPEFQTNSFFLSQIIFTNLPGDYSYEIYQFKKNNKKNFHGIRNFLNEFLIRRKEFKKPDRKLK